MSDLFLVKLEVPYMSDEAWEKFDYQKLVEVAPFTLPEEKPKDRWYLNLPDEVRLTYDESCSLVEVGLEVKVVVPRGTQLTKLRERNEWEPDAAVTPKHLQEGKAVQITVADIGLMMIDEVTWMEDACTEELQTKLEKGWRILAVCPPCAQRRPDYILGRRKV